MELEALQEVMPEISAAGACLVAVSPQRKEYSRQLVRKHSLTFDVLQDEGNRLAREFGLEYTLPDDLRRIYLSWNVDLERFHGDSSWTLPMPARFIIDQASVIRYAEVNPDYTVRPEPADTLQALRAILGS